MSRRSNSAALSPRQRGQLYVGLAGLALTAGYLIMTVRELRMGTLAQPGPGAFPLVAAAVMALASLALIWEQLRDTSGAGGSLGLPHGADLRRVLGVGASIAAYAALVSTLGHLLASLLTAVVMMKLLKPDSWRATLARATGLAVATWVVFVLILGVPLPTGALF